MKRPDSLLLSETHAERGRLADLLSGLSAEQWDTASLCDGWRVHEVVAHLTMPFRTRAPAVIAGMVRAGFSFNRYADRDARMTARTMSGPDLVEILRANIGHPWSPPGGGQVGALSHDVIHGLDATEPLGLPAAPADRIARVLASTSTRQIKYFGANLDGMALSASDADLTIGDGASVLTMPVREILLVVTGRRALDDVPRAER